MKVVTAMLCNHAVVHSGLLTIVDGGITRSWAPNLPSRLSMWLAVQMGLEPSELGKPHEVRVLFLNPDNVRVAQLVSAVQAEKHPKHEDGERVLVPLAVSLLPVNFEKYGRHSVTIMVDSKVSRVLEFWLQHPDERVLPPIQLP
jgi:hypothetical protein